MAITRDFEQRIQVKADSEHWHRSKDKISAFGQNKAFTTKFFIKVTLNTHKNFFLCSPWPAELEDASLMRGTSGSAVCYGSEVVTGAWTVARVCPQLWSFPGPDSALGSSSCPQAEDSVRTEKKSGGAQRGCFSGFRQERVKGAWTWKQQLAKKLFWYTFHPKAFLELWIISHYPPQLTLIRGLSFEILAAEKRLPWLHKITETNFCSYYWVQIK